MALQIQKQSVGILEDFFLSTNDRDVYIFLQEVLGRPLLKKVLEKGESNSSEAENQLRLSHTIS